MVHFWYLSISSRDEISFCQNACVCHARLGIFLFLALFLLKEFQYIFNFHFSVRMYTQLYPTDSSIRKAFSIPVYNFIICQKRKLNKLTVQYDDDETLHLHKIVKHTQKTIWFASGFSLFVSTSLHNWMGIFVFGSHFIFVCTVNISRTGSVSTGMWKYSFLHCKKKECPCEK